MTRGSRKRYPTVKIGGMCHILRPNVQHCHQQVHFIRVPHSRQALISVHELPLIVSSLFIRKTANAVEWPHLHLQRYGRVVTCQCVEYCVSQSGQLGPLFTQERERIC
ncbi:hypothetical protein Tsp_06429 [Trichinella spiralis]|uniref:hypothetical protein n=1 Tax=Trichinella spiralis TaxID=6334 RepID=UPI0001EFC4C9|nr:hypothetical protein Tsp_06429 [Trichinella spiralis]